jgi:helix-turn-helix protein
VIKIKGTSDENLSIREVPKNVFKFKAFEALSNRAFVEELNHFKDIIK